MMNSYHSSNEDRLFNINQVDVTIQVKKVKKTLVL